MDRLCGFIRAILLIVSIGLKRLDSRLFVPIKEHH